MTTAAIELRREIPTVEEAIREVGRIKAAEDLLSEHDKTVRAVLQEAADAHRAAGRETAWSEKLKGVGHAYVTQPDPRPSIDDRDAFAAWAQAHAAGRCQTVPRVDAAQLEQLLREGNVALRALLEELSPTLVRDEILVEEGLAQDVLDGATLAGAEDPDALEGKVVDPETGEVIPGLTWRRGKGSLTVKPDAAYRRAQLEALRAQLAPALEAGDEVVDGELVAP